MHSNCCWIQAQKSSLIAYHYHHFQHSTSSILLILILTCLNKLVKTFSFCPWVAGCNYGAEGRFIISVILRLQSTRGSVGPFIECSHSGPVQLVQWHQGRVGVAIHQQKITCHIYAFSQTAWICGKNIAPKKWYKLLSSCSCTHRCYKISLSIILIKFINKWQKLYISHIGVASLDKNIC